MAPPTAAPWPSMYLVVECVTISAPHSMGRQLTGVGNVLSTISGTPWASGVHDGTAHGRAVTVHVLGSGVRHDIGAPLNGTAIDGRGEGVVHDQRHTGGVRGRGEALDVEHGEGRVRDGLAEDALGDGAEGRLELLIGRDGGDKGALQAHAAHGVDEQIVAAPVDGRARHHVIARPGDIEDGEEVRDSRPMRRMVWTSRL